MSKRQAAAAVRMAETAVRDCLYRAKAAHLLMWPLPDGLDDGDLEDRLYGRSGGRSPAPRPWVMTHDY